MKAGFSRIVSVIVALALIFPATALADPTTEARNLLEFCLAHPEACSISIDYEKGETKWSIDYNGTRLNSLASTVKVIDLVAYGVAVDERRINPQQLVSRDDWAQFFIGRDGGAFGAAYTRLSKGQPAPPTTVTNDQIVSAMIQESDNAAADYLLDKLGYRFMGNILDRYISGPGHGYADFPQSISAMFSTWEGNPTDSLSGIKALNNYSGFASDEYQDEIDDVFAQMKHRPSLVSAMRTYNGYLLPWVVGPPPPPAPIPLSEAQYERLETAYATRSNTRTYNELMLRLLRRNLLTPNAQQIVEGFLEYKLKANPPIADLAQIDRYGVKDGAFSAQNGITVRTRTIYLENKDGTRVVFTVHLTGSPGTSTDLGKVEVGLAGSRDSAVRNFGLALAIDPVFAVEVQNKLGPKEDKPAPSLIARIVRNRSTPGRIRLAVEITNIGTLATERWLNIGLFFSDDGTTHGVDVDHDTFPPLQPGESWRVELDSRSFAASKFFVLVVDPANVIPASEKQDNPQFEIIPGH